MKKHWLPAFGLLTLALIPLSASEARAEEKTHHFKRTDTFVDGNLRTPVEMDVTIHSDGSFTKTIKVEQWPCAHTDPHDKSNWCVGAFAMALKAKDGKWVRFTDEGHMSLNGYSFSTSGKHKIIADNYERFVDGSYEARWAFEGHTAGWGGSFLNDLLKDVEKALVIIGPALLSL